MRPTRGDEHSDLHRKVVNISTVCVMIYIAIYTFESPLRYILVLVHASQIILARDGLIFLPVALLVGVDLARQKIHPAVLIAGVVLPIGFVVGFLNFGTLAPPSLGFKMFVNVVLGSMIAGMIIDPSPRLFRIFVAFWAATIVGVVLEKYFVSYPWVGMHAQIGNLDVEISRDWQVSDSFDKRVGGFTRVSISAAGLMPLLCCIAISQFKSELLRHGMMLVTVAAVFMTTQKGALLAMIVVWGTMLVPMVWRIAAQGVVALLAILVDMTTPVFTGVLHIPQGVGGSFSSASIVQRIMTTWPDTFNWIERKQLMPFGVGLGGIGDAQRFVASAAFHYPDNMFLFLASTFGILAVPLFGLLAYAPFNGMRHPSRRVSAALSVFTFVLIYGTFVSIIEDQLEALFLGAAVGTLFAKSAARESFKAAAVHTGRIARMGARTRPQPGAARLT